MDKSAEQKPHLPFQRATLDARLLEKLRCPACNADLRNEEESALLCTACGRTYPVVAGIPELVYFPQEDSEEAMFDSEQARYERQVHDRQAPHEYEDRVVAVYGDKTELIATSWAKAFRGPILDYGSGTGQLSRVLKRHHSPVYAFDISSASLAENVRDNAVLAVAANAFHLPFRDRCFETVCCNGVLHHIIDLQSAIQEMARVTSTCLAISEPCTIAHQRTPWKKLRVPTELLKAAFRAVLVRAFVLWDVITGRRRDLTAPAGRQPASRYERPLEPEEVIELLAQAGFRLTMLRFWTNIGWKRRSRIKKLLTRMFVSSKVGTHFEIRVARKPKSRNAGKVEEVRDQGVSHRA